MIAIQSGLAAREATIEGRHVLKDGKDKKEGWTKLGREVTE